MSNSDSAAKGMAHMGSFQRGVTPFHRVKIGCASSRSSCFVMFAFVVPLAMATVTSSALDASACPPRQSSANDNHRKTRGYNCFQQGNAVCLTQSSHAPRNFYCEYLNNIRPCSLGSKRCQVRRKQCAVHVTQDFTRYEKLV